MAAFVLPYNMANRKYFFQDCPKYTCDQAIWPDSGSGGCPTELCANTDSTCMTNCDGKIGVKIDALWSGKKCYKPAVIGGPGL